MSRRNLVWVFEKIFLNHAQLWFKAIMKLEIVTDRKSYEEGKIFSTLVIISSEDMYSRNEKIMSPVARKA